MNSDTLFMKASDVYEQLNPETHTFFPFVEIQGRLIQFTETILECKGTGAKLFLVKDKEGNVTFLYSHADLDCDGTFWDNHYQDEVEEAILEQDYNIQNLDINSKFLFGRFLDLNK
jgi:hypothetical protein